jgi:low affinity Fe/Cu permease
MQDKSSLHLRTQGASWMIKGIKTLETRTLHERFGRFSAGAHAWFGSTWAFLVGGMVIVGWAAAGPMLHFSSRWVQVIQTVTSIATFLMVFLIQNTQNRDARAINLKLNELIRAVDKARNQMIDIERLSDVELDEMQATYEKIKTAWTSRRPVTAADSKQD